jgi:hypothetical protein
LGLSHLFTFTFDIFAQLANFGLSVFSTHFYYHFRFRT